MGLTFSIRFTETSHRQVAVEAPDEATVRAILTDGANDEVLDLWIESASEIDGGIDESSFVVEECAPVLLEVPWEPEWGEPT